MELTWSTFALEILNFLVLVWILKRFLYKPVLDVVARRRAGIEKQLADAAALEADAQALRARYQGRVEEWNAERQKALEALNREVEAERGKRLAALEEVLERERKKAEAAAERGRADAAARLERTALEQGASFAAKLLSTAAGPETERRLAALAIDALGALPPGRAAELTAGGGEPPDRITVASAYPLDAAECGRLRAALAKLLGGEPSFEFVEDASLVAGLAVTVGPWRLGLNVRDELAGFTRLAGTGERMSDGSGKAAE